MDAFHSSQLRCFVNTESTTAAMTASGRRRACSMPSFVGKGPGRSVATRPQTVPNARWAVTLSESAAAAGVKLHFARDRRLVRLDIACREDGALTAETFLRTNMLSSAPQFVLGGIAQPASLKSSPHATHAKAMPALGRLT
jgi:hypothetical protein